MTGTTTVTERILLALALAHVVAGLALAALPLAPQFHADLVAVVFGKDGNSEAAMFLVSVFGPTVASWGVLFFALVKTYFRSPAVGTWRALVLSILIWAPLDSLLCIRYGLYPAVALNAVVAAVLLGLLLGVRRLPYTASTESRS